MKKYFYCQSYQFFNLALSYNMTEEIIIISSVKNIIDACKFLNIEYISHDPFTAIEMIKRKNSVFIEINRIIKLIGNNELHFSHTQYAIFCFYLVKKSIDHNKIVIFHNFEFVYERIKIGFGYSHEKIYKYFILMMLKLLYNLPIELGKSSGNTFMICLKFSYIQRKVNKIIDNKDTYYIKTLECFKKFKINYPEINILFIAQYPDNNFFYIEKIKEIFSILNNKLVSVKMHPKLGHVEGLNDCSILPEFLPVELFFNKVKNYVISFHSASLITASKFEQFKTISLLDIVGIEDPFILKVKCDLISKSNNKILFPKNIKELKEII